MLFLLVFDSSYTLLALALIHSLFCQRACAPYSLYEPETDRSLILFSFRCDRKRQKGIEKGENDMNEQVLGVIQKATPQYDVKKFFTME